VTISGHGVLSFVRSLSLSKGLGFGAITRWGLGDRCAGNHPPAVILDVLPLFCVAGSRQARPRPRTYPPDPTASFASPVGFAARAER
jgi:hypothetical protein